MPCAFQLVLNAELYQAGDAVEAMIKGLSLSPEHELT